MIFNSIIYHKYYSLKRKSYVILLHCMGVNSSFVRLMLVYFKYVSNDIVVVPVTPVSYTNVFVVYIYVI